MAWVNVLTSGLFTKTYTGSLLETDSGFLRNVSWASTDLFPESSFTADETQVSNSDSYLTIARVDLDPFHLRYTIVGGSATPDQPEEGVFVIATYAPSSNNGATQIPTSPSWPFEVDLLADDLLTEVDIGITGKGVAETTGDIPFTVSILVEAWVPDGPDNDRTGEIDGELSLNFSMVLSGVEATNVTGILRI